MARKGESTIVQTAKDFGISPATLHRWLKQVVEDHRRPGRGRSRVTKEESTELREAKKRIRLLEQETEVMRRAVAYLSRDVNPK